MTDFLRLSAEFPPADEAAWAALAEKALKGKPLDALNSKTEHGVTVKGLYRETDWASSKDPSGLPGALPLTRGAKAGKDQYLPWDIRQVVGHVDPDVARSHVMEALEHGVSSIELLIDDTGEHGIAVNTAKALSDVLG